MKYIYIYFVSLITITLTIGSFNWLIDPFGMYWSPTIAGINEIKPKAKSRTRISKAYRVDSIKPQVLIVGNSRVEMGLDPQHPIFGGRRVYNQGMPGAYLHMQIDYALDVIEYNPSLEEVIMGIDYLDFLMGPVELVEQENIENTDKNYSKRLLKSKDDISRLQEKATLIFSLDSLFASIATVFKQSAVTSTITDLGFNTADSYIDIISHESIKPLFSEKLEWLEQKLEPKNGVILSQDSFPYSPKFQQLGQLITAAKQKNVRLTFFINSYHYSYLQILSEQKQWGNFQTWKRTLVRYLEESEVENIPLWDFSSIDDYASEHVPLENPKKQMKWYWEPAHYKKELGDIMLNEMFSRDNSTAFGVPLTLSNIGDVIDKDQQGLLNTSEKWQHLKKSLNL
jgi:hypothetical protein